MTRAGRHLRSALVGLGLLLTVAAFTACSNTSAGENIAGDEHPAAAAAQAEADHEDAEAHEDAETHEDADDEGGEAHTADLDAGDARAIIVTATEFSFGPSEIHVKVGETVKLVLQNEGAILHDISSMQFVGDADAVGGGGDHHATTMADMDGMAFHVSAQSHESGELLFTATEPGRYKLFCSVPGHEQLGMVATLVVE